MSCEMCEFSTGPWGVQCGEVRDLDCAGVTARIAKYRSVHDLPAIVEVHFESDAVEVHASVPIAYCPWCGRKLDDEGGGAE